MLSAPGALSQASPEGVEAGARPRGHSVSRTPPSATALGPEQAQPSRVVVRLWLPTTVIFLLLSPFAILLTPLLYLVPRRYRGSPLATVLGVGRLLLSLGGVVVHVDTPEALVSIRIF